MSHHGACKRVKGGPVDYYIELALPIGAWPLISIVADIEDLLSHSFILLPLYLALIVSHQPPWNFAQLIEHEDYSIRPLFLATNCGESFVVTSAFTAGM
jgi:hypothetical protein